MEVGELKRRLADRAQGVAEHLLPRGKRLGSEWRAGSIEGEPGDSLGVHLSGPKAGVWGEFNGGMGGDLLDLWMAVKGITLTEAMSEACDWLGVERPQVHRPPRKDWHRPAKPRCRIPKGPVEAYLAYRGIPAEIVRRYRVGENGPLIVFPFVLPDGTLALVKIREAVDGAKPRPTEAGCAPVLFGWQAIDANAREIVITEGEIDALAMAAYGRPAVSVPFGGGGGAKQSWIENEFERMERFERIYLALDADEPGEQAAQAIAERLGRHRCYRVCLPEKDADACLMAGVEKAAIDACFAAAETYDPEGLRLPTDYTEQVIALFWPEPGAHVGYAMPYAKLVGLLHFRPAEVTLWSGDSGSGKSQILNDCTIDWIKQGSRVCLSSLEMKPQMTLKRMVKQALGADRPTEAAIRATHTWLTESGSGGGLMVYELTGKAKLDQLLDVFDYARAKYGCDQFIIDSMMRLGIASDDLVTQEQAAYRLVDWAIARSVHVHLVAHARKGDQMRGAPETRDIKGAMEIGANAFNILIMWRNRKLEERLRAAQSTGDEAEIAELARQPPVILNIDKQRNGDFEGKVGLWFDQECYQYRSAMDGQAARRCYIDTESIRAAETGYPGAKGA